MCLYYCSVEDFRDFRGSVVSPDIVGLYRIVSVCPWNSIIWNGLDVRYVNPRNSSKTCPLCSGRMTSYEGRSMRCGKCGLVMNRIVVAVLNFQMWGIGFTPKALNEIIKREELSRG